MIQLSSGLGGQETVFITCPSTLSYLSMTNPVLTGGRITLAPVRVPVCIAAISGMGLGAPLR
jgi:hypothetical protein